VYSKYCCRPIVAFLYPRLSEFLLGRNVYCSCPGLFISFRSPGLWRPICVYDPDILNEPLGQFMYMEAIVNTVSPRGTALSLAMVFIEFAYPGDLLDLGPFLADIIIKCSIDRFHLATGRIIGHYDPFCLGLFIW